MAKLYLIALTLILNHEVSSQLIRSSLPIRSLADAIMESSLQQFEPSQYIRQAESPRYTPIGNPYIPITSQNAPNNPNLPINIPKSLNIPGNRINTPNPLVNIPNSPLDIPYSAINIPYSPINIPYSPRITQTNPTVINSNRSPSICKNLGNTIHLMMMSDYLQNQNGGDEILLKMAAPILGDLLSPIVIGSSDSISPNVLGSPNSVGNLVGSNLRSFLPNLVSIPSVVPSPISKLVASNSPNIISNNIMSSIASDGKIERGLYSKLLKLVGSEV